MAKKLILFLACLIALERFCHQQTEGFQIYKITSPPVFEWREEPLSLEQHQEIGKILDQPFQFIGSGHQSYAFESADGLTVLKFLKHTRKKRLSKLFSSCRLAYEQGKEEAGLLYAHLQPKTVWNKKVEIIDKIGIHHQIEIDQTTFLLQKKADLFCSNLNEKTIQAFIDHIKTRTERGIANLDAMVERNYGIVEGKVIDIDIGSFIPLKGPRVRQIFYELLPLRAYLQQNNPNLLDYFDEQAKLALR